MRCMPIKYTPVREAYERDIYEMHGCEVHICDMHASKDTPMIALEMHDCESSRIGLSMLFLVLDPFWL